MRFSLFFSLVLLLPSLLIIGPQEGDAISSSPLRIQLDQNKHTAFLNGEDDYLINITCSVKRCYTGDERNYSLNITATSDDFEVSEPVRLEFVNGTSVSKNFTFTVKVPWNATNQRKYSVILDGRCKINGTNLGFNLGPEQVLIVCKQYFKADLFIDENIRVMAGKTVSLDYIAFNEGNGDDRFRIDILDRYHIEKRGWKVKIGPDKINVEHKGSRTGKINITVPEDEKPGTHEIDVILLEPELMSPNLEEILDRYSVVKIIEVEVLNNYKDELKIAMMIATPIFILMMILFASFSLLVKRNEKVRFKVLRITGARDKF
jgi:hypothetical protein